MKKANNVLYFKLFANCVPVKGAVRSIICDLQRGNFDFIPNSLYDLLSLYRNKSLSEIELDFASKEDKEIINEYYEFLIQKEYGFWCEKEFLECFPDLDLKWEIPSVITNAIIDVDANSNHDFENIFSQLEKLGCKAIQIRFYSYKPISKIERILSHLSLSKILSVELLIKHHKSHKPEEISNFICKNGRIKNIIIHSSPKNEIIKSNLSNGMGNILYHDKVIDSSAHCGAISPNYFTINLPFFSEAKKYNSCLNQKISIDVKGDIKNCPSTNKVYGNLLNSTLFQVLSDVSFKELWNVNKDQIEICKDCEFRYICVDCRAFTENEFSITSKPLKCKYNPYKAQWIN